MRILPMLFALVLLPNPATAQSYYHLQPDGSGSTDIIWCTFSGNACENGAVIPFESSVTPRVHNTLVAHSPAGTAVHWDGPATILVNCDLFGNAGGDYTGTLAGALGVDDNIQADPQFCSPIPDDHESWTLQEDSPCTALNSGAGMRIGAYGRACGTVAPRATSWGALKNRHR